MSLLSEIYQDDHTTFILLSWRNGQIEPRKFIYEDFASALESFAHLVKEEKTHKCILRSSTGKVFHSYERRDIKIERYNYIQ